MGSPAPEQPAYKSRECNSFARLGQPRAGASYPLESSELDGYAPDPVVVAYANFAVFAETVDAAHAVLTE